MQAKWQDSRYFVEHNEMLLKDWGQGKGPVLPIQAFFYAPGGLEDARASKRRYLAKYSIDVPVIRITLPTVANGTATFQYLSSDQ